MRLDEAISSLESLLNEAIREGVRDEVEIVLTFQAAVDLHQLLLSLAPTAAAQPKAGNKSNAWGSPFENGYYQGPNYSKEEMEKMFEDLLKAGAAFKFSGFYERNEKRSKKAGRKAWHEVLEVAPDASREAIQAAYRRLAKLHHPDHGGSTEKMAEINAARDEALG